MDEINNHLHWSKKEKNFIRENIGVMTLEDMSKHVHRSVMAVRLLIHRNKWTNSNVLQHNPLIKLLKAKFNHIEDFSPSRTFYDETRISQKRFWKLFKGEMKITQEEYLAVSRYLDVPPMEAFDAIQLELFTEDD